MRVRLSALAAAIFVLAACLGAPSAAAQDVTTVKGPGSGEETTMSLSPHRVTEEISIRALGVAGPDSTRWAFTLIGADEVESVSFVVAEETTPALRLEDANDMGAVTAFVTRDTFLSLSQSDASAIRINGNEASLPEAVRNDMKSIFRKVN